MGKVSIIMGSKSDLPIMKKVAETLEEFEVEYSMNIFSAHRTPTELSRFVKKVNADNDYKVIIAGAGMSAALAGAIAAETSKPVIGIPLSGGKYHGIEAALATSEMPPGNPVLTVGIDATKNAALGAIRIIALSDPYLSNKLVFWARNQRDAVLAADESIQ